jgi:acyl-CoA reductase-like NAD-dependent aldehyde dehydrogenase
MLQTIMRELNEKRFPIEFPGHWIRGQWQQIGKGKNKVPSINPSRNQKLIEFSIEPQSMQMALECAEEFRSDCERISLAERQQIVGKFRRWLAEYTDAVINSMCTESGKPRWEAHADMDAAIRHLDFVTSQAEQIIDSGLAAARASGKFANLSYEQNPVGVTVGFIPFSSPITSLAQYFSATVMAGCPLILVVSHHAILTGVLAGCFAESVGLHPGSLNVVFSNFDACKQFISDRRIKAVLYTGSREHCDTIRRESASYPGRQLILQSGGKNSVLVDESADIKQAINIIAFGAFKSAGQLCTATSRVFVHETMTNQLAEGLAQFVGEMTVGPTDDASQNPLMGPVYTKKAVEKFLRFQTMAHREEAKSIHWGKSVDAKTDGFFVRPGVHLMKEFDPKSAYQSNVLLCPDVCVYSFSDMDWAVERLNDTDAPFAMSFVGDASIIQKCSSRIRIPNIMINLPTVEIESSLPLAGRRHSGQHRFSGASLISMLSFPKAWQKAANFDGSICAWPAPNF